ncbi:MAG TPA: NAD(P)H-dependent oxidoreductase subunit E [Solirubrobacter sp.]|nr:NAD(P)H-dependent oxidoreductase subunit E [Solirubrobacter sp.]
MEVKRYAHGSRVPGWDQSVDLSKDPAAVPDPATTHVPEHVRASIEVLMARYPDTRSAAIPSLKIVQREHGWLSPEAMEQAACVLRLTPAYLIAVASFYDMFELAPKGATDVYVCTNISCSLLGGDEIYAHAKQILGDDPNFNVRAFECLGACEIAPMASVDGTYVGPLTRADIERIRDDVEAGREVLEDKQLKRRPAASKHWNR